jgi:hypothetical protein
MSSVTRARRAVLAAAAIALPLSLLPLASAAADPAPPQFAYQDTSATYSRVLSSAAADGSGATALLPAGYQVKSFVVSQDGRTELIGLCHGLPADCANKGSANGYLNITYSLLLVHNDGTTTKSRVLSTYWDTKPALGDDGSPVWMVHGTLYRIDVNSFSTDAWLTAAPVHTSSWAPPANGYTDSLAVFGHGDSAQIAVIEEDGNTPANLDVRAGDFSSPGGGNHLLVTYAGTAARLPSDHNFVFLDATHLAYGAYQPGDAAEYSAKGQDYYPLYTEIGTLDATGGTHAENTALDDTYQLSPFAASSGYYAWKDHTDGTNDVSSYALVTGDLSTTGTTTVGTFTDRSNGETTTNYMPTAVTAPALSTTDLATNRSAAHTYLAFRSSVLVSNAVNYFVVENDYYQDPALGTFVLNASAPVSVGEMQYSYDKVHWLHSVNTQGAYQRKIGTFTAMGSTQKLTRNTWFRWYYKGDLITAAGSTSPRLVKVAPTITVKVARSGSRRTVYGSVLRSRGKIELLHKVGTRYRVVATAVISSRGAYSFGKRVLARGTYEVVSLADAGWAASAKGFKI